jgi:hypothetical protein
MLRRVALVRTDASEVRIASIIRVRKTRSPRRHIPEDDILQNMFLAMTYISDDKAAEVYSTQNIRENIRESVASLRPDNEASERYSRHRIGENIRASEILTKVW